jgi:hypothetical protein
MGGRLYASRTGAVVRRRDRTPTEEALVIGPTDGFCTDPRRFVAYALPVYFENFRIKRVQLDILRPDRHSTARQVTLNCGHARSKPGMAAMCHVRTLSVWKSRTYCSVVQVLVCRRIGNHPKVPRVAATTSCQRAQWSHALPFLTPGLVSLIECVANSGRQITLGDRFLKHV